MAAAGAGVLTGSADTGEGVVAATGAVVGAAVDDSVGVADTAAMIGAGVGVGVAIEDGVAASVAVASGGDGTTAPPGVPTTMLGAAEADIWPAGRSEGMMAMIPRTIHTLAATSQRPRAATTRGRLAVGRQRGRLFGGGASRASAKPGADAVSGASGAVAVPVAARRRVALDGWVRRLRCFLVMRFSKH